MAVAEIDRPALEREADGRVPSLGEAQERSRALGLAGSGVGSLASLWLRAGAAVIETILLVPIALGSALLIPNGNAGDASAEVGALALVLAGALLWSLSVRAWGSGPGGLLLRIGVFDQRKLAELIERAPHTLSSTTARLDPQLRPSWPRTIAAALVRWGVLGVATLAWVSPLSLVPLLASVALSLVRPDRAGLAELLTATVWVRTGEPPR